MSNVLIRLCVSAPTCLFIQCKQTGHVTREDIVGDLSKPARISVRGDYVEDFCARLGVAADAHGVLVRVEHWSVIVQILYLNVHVRLSTQASLEKRERRIEEYYDHETQKLETQSTDG